MAQSISLPHVDMGVLMEALVAVGACGLLLLSLPAGSRIRARWPVLLLIGAPFPWLLSLLFPGFDGVVTAAKLLSRFLLLASLLQSILLLTTACIWERIRKPLPRIVVDVLRWITVAIAFAALLHEGGINAQNLFTGSAMLTAALGFALKDTLGNVFAGLAIHAEHPFEVGDWIQYDTNPAHIGRVVEVNWRATKVITLDEAYVIIPNGQLAQASIRNFTKPDPWSRRSLFVIAPYGVPPQRIQTIILDAIRGSFGVLEHPNPSVVTNDFKDRGVEYWVRFFTKDFDKRDRVDGMARDRIWYALARHGIEIPVATHSVRLTQMPVPREEPVEEAVERRVARLRTIGLLSVFDESELHRVAREGAERLYAIGEPIVRQGASGESMFVLLHGHVEVTARKDDGPSTRFATLNSGDYFGEMSLMTGAPRSATVTALEETRVLEISKESFGSIMALRPELVVTLGNALQDRMAERDVALANARQQTAESGDLFRRIRQFFAL
ncbi:MAG: hypothetical protein RLZ45_2804 [Verrucomicrobiota bacterium]|jgi:small-conductance mechanosensitive channel/CRP-like cAMP-binding protein